MKLVVGLGNPGSKYTKTLHNVGFRIVDAFLADKPSSFSMWRDLALVSQVVWAQQSAWFIKPQTYMNRSGLAVGPFVAKKGLDWSDVLVIHDDVDLPIGRLKISFAGGSGGHKGLDSIFDIGQSRSFYRLRVGIGRDCQMDTADYVLHRVSDQLLEVICNPAVLALEQVFNQGPHKAMNDVNAQREPAADL